MEEIQEINRTTRARGRPKGSTNLTPKERVLRSAATELPTLKEGNRTTFRDLCSWALRLTSAQRNLITIYVYRTFPVVDNSLANPGAKKYLHVYSGDTFIADYKDPSDCDRSLLSKFGSGDYKYMINEGSQNRWTVLAKGHRDFDAYPPLVDPATLIEGDPANLGYVMWARQRGQFKPQSEAAKELSDMQVVKDLTEQNNGLINAALDLAGKAGEAKAGAAQAVMDGLRQGIELVKDIKNAESSQHTDGGVLETSRALVDLVKAMAPQQQGKQESSEIVGILQTMLTSAERRAERLEERLTAQATNTTPPQTLSERIEELNNLKEALRDSGPASKSNPGSGNMLMEIFARNAQPIAAAAANIVQNLAMVAMASLAPNRPVPGPVHPQMAPNPTQMTYNDSPVISVPPAPSTITEAHQTPARPQNTGNEMLDYMTPTLLYHYAGDSGRNGETFAPRLPLVSQ